MKLICQTATEKGRTVEVGALGVTLGREQDNDVVLTEPELSRYHARVSQDDGVWYLHDLDSMNGVYLNDKRIDKRAPLSLHDCIRIGKGEWIFTDDSGSLPKGAAGAPANKDTDAGEGDDAGAGAGAGSRKRRILAMVVILFLLGLIGVQVLLITTQEQAPDTTGAVAAGTGPLRVVYEKFIMNDDGIFRYSFDLNGPLMRVQVDDLRNRRHLEEQHEVSDEFLERFAEDCLTDDFLRLTVAPGFASETRVDETRLAVWQGRRGNAVAIVNEVVPPAVEAIADNIEVAVEELIGLVAVPLTREEIIDRAREKFAFAERSYVERDVQADNLYHALMAYRFVTEYLAGFDDRPDFYETAVRREREVQAELDKKLEQLRYAARMQVRVNELDKAREHYEQIVARVPDAKHPIVQNAREQIYKIARRLEAQKKQKK